MENIECPQCLLKNYKTIYTYNCDAGLILGKIEVVNVMCENCGFVYMNPRPDKSLIAEHYKSQSSGNTYHEMSDNSRHDILTKERKDFIESHIKITNGKVIDIGCGQGQLLKELDLPDLIKHGLDPSQTNQDVIEKKINFFSGFIEDYKNVDNDYDIVICISSLEHYYDPRFAVEIFSNIIKDKGLLFVEIPDSLRPISQISEFYSFEHLSHFTHYTISKLLGLYNFQIIAIDENVSIPNIRLVAKKTEGKINNLFTDDRKKLISTIQKYKNKRKAIFNKIDSKIIPPIKKLKENNKKIGIYGAGIHTNFLLDNFDIIDLISVFIDSDPDKWGTSFHNLKIHSPEEINELDIGGILISSHDYEMEIFDTINKYNVKNIPIIKCYND